MLRAVLGRLPVIGRFLILHEKSTNAVKHAHESADRADKLIKDYRAMRFQRKDHWWGS